MKHLFFFFYVLQNIQKKKKARVHFFAPSLPSFRLEKKVYQITFLFSGFERTNKIPDLFSNFQFWAKYFWLVAIVETLPAGSFVFVFSECLREVPPPSPPQYLFRGLGRTHLGGMLYSFVVQIHVVGHGVLPAQLRFDVRPTIAEVEAHIWQVAEGDATVVALMEEMGVGCVILRMRVRVCEGARWARLLVGSQLRPGAEIVCEIGTPEEDATSLQDTLNRTNAIRSAAVSASTNWRVTQSAHLTTEPAPRQISGPLLTYIPQSFETALSHERGLSEAQRQNRRQLILERRL